MAFANRNLSKNALLKNWILANWRQFSNASDNFWYLSSKEFNPHQEDWFAQFTAFKTRAEVIALLPTDFVDRFYICVERLDDGHMFFIIRSSCFTQEFLTEKRAESKLYSIIININDFPSRTLYELYQSYGELKGQKKG